MNGLIFEKDFPAETAPRIIAAENFDEGAFARAVFTAKGVHFPLLKIQGNAVQRTNSGKIFGDIFEFKQRHDFYHQGHQVHQENQNRRFDLKHYQELISSWCPWCLGGSNDYFLYTSSFFWKPSAMMVLSILSLSTSIAGKRTEGTSFLPLLTIVVLSVSGCFWARAMASSTAFSASFLMGL